MLSNLKSQAQAQFSKIYTLVEARLAKMGLEIDLVTSLQFFLFLNALIAFYCLSLTSNLEIFVIPLLIFGYSVWEIWQNLQALKAKKPLKQSELVFKAVNFLYLLPSLISIISLFLIPLVILLWSPLIPFWSWPVFAFYGLVFLLPSMLISIVVFGLLGLSLVIYWSKTKEMLTKANQNLGVEVEVISK